jgi:hypothetical protein
VERGCGEKVRNAVTFLREIRKFQFPRKHTSRWAKNDELLKR